MKNKLRELRQSANISQQNLAQVLGVSRQTIISIERGKFDPSLPLAFRIAQTFDCKIEDIFMDEENLK
ncbi:helix-turn-helix transcriptional regulator [Lactiplantibacillus plantarum]|uniref:helix-turn-helix transcriptional regulator n=1 Tax=Lactiplantibacillus plantarum TaxID=1590 RepID=UPI003096DB5C